MFIDSVIWIAYKNKNDSWHDGAKRLLPTIPQVTNQAAIMKTVMVIFVYGSCIGTWASRL